MLITSNKHKYKALSFSFKILVKYVLKSLVWGKPILCNKICMNKSNEISVNKQKSKYFYKAHKHEIYV